MAPADPPLATSEPALTRALRQLGGGEAVYRLCFVLCAGFMVAPLWAGPVLPFQDYAGNLSYAAIVAGSSDPTSLFAQTYLTEGLLWPNSLFFFAWGWLAHLTGYIAAGQLLLSLYVVALPWSLDRLLRAAGRAPAFALLAFPLAMNGNFMMGFIGFATALPIALYCMTRAIYYRERPTLAGAAIVCGLAMLTFLGHAQMYLVLGIVSITFVLAGARSIHDLLRTAAPFAASLVLFLPWFWLEFVRPKAATSLGGRPLDPIYTSAGESFSRLAEHALARWSGSFDDRVFLGILGVMALGLLERRPSEGPPGRRYTLEIISVVLFVAYLTLPEHTQVQAAIASRLVPIGLIFGTGWLFMPRQRWLRGVALASMLALSIVHGLGTARAVRHFNTDEVGPGFIELVDSLPEESRLAYMALDRSSDAVTVLPHEHLYGYHFALNRGVSYSGFHSFVGRHAGWRPGKQVPWPGRDVRAFLRSKTACYYGYLLIRSHQIPRWRELEPRVTFLGSSARYTLWKVEHDAIAACIEPPEEDQDKALKIVETEPGDRKLRPRRPLSATLTPEVGHARGRSVDGGWAPAERARYRPKTPDERVSPPDKTPGPARPEPKEGKR